MRKARFSISLERLVASLQQASTWRGITAIAMACGIAIDPELQAHIITVGLSIIGAINIGKST